MIYRRNMVDRARRLAWSYGALLGVGGGALFEMLLREVPNLRVLAVDHFLREDRWQRACGVAARHAGRVLILRHTTAVASSFVPPASLDFVYIDAGHKYGCVRSDIRRWWPKVCEGGWFGGHDYTPQYPGLMAAVDERFADCVTIDADTIWWVKKA